MDLLEVEMANHTIHFHIDSQGAMKALETFFTKHKCVAEGKRLLNKLTEYNNKVYLNWIPGHTGQVGIGIADNLARLGDEYADEGLETRLPIFNSSLKGFIKEWLKRA